MCFFFWPPHFLCYWLSVTRCIQVYTRCSWRQHIVDLQSGMWTCVFQIFGPLLVASFTPAITFALSVTPVWPHGWGLAFERSCVRSERDAHVPHMEVKALPLLKSLDCSPWLHPDIWMKYVAESDSRRQFSHLSAERGNVCLLSHFESEFTISWAKDWLTSKPVWSQSWSIMKRAPVWNKHWESLSLKMSFIQLLKYFHVHSFWNFEPFLKEKIW